MSCLSDYPFLDITSAVQNTGTSSSIKFGLDKWASLLASAVETLAQLVEGYLSEASESEDSGHTQHLTLLLGVMVAMARSVQETLSPKQAMQARCIACLHSSLSSTYPAVSPVTKFFLVLENWVS
jgi:VIT1/CCC1 family predicted Fe2+/Mn2+ transporter